MTSEPKDTYQPASQNRASTTPGVLMITGDKVEDLEFFYPYYRFIEAGYRVDVATLDGKSFKGKQGLELQTSIKISNVSPGDYAMLYLPGGKAPAKLKDDKDVLSLVCYFMKAGKPIAAICHGPQILAAADIVRDRKIAAWPEVEDELQAAGAIYVNQETVTDGQFITARWPADLPAHMKQTLEKLREATQDVDRRHAHAA